jgi:hypothetical protein
MDRARRNRLDDSSPRRCRELLNSTISMKRERIPAQIPSAIVLGDVHMGQSPISPIPTGRAITTRSTIRTSVRRTFIGPRLPAIVALFTSGDAPVFVEFIAVDLALAKRSSKRIDRNHHSGFLCTLERAHAPKKAQQHPGEEAVVQPAWVDQTLQDLALPESDETRRELPRWRVEVKSQCFVLYLDHERDAVAPDLVLLGEPATQLWVTHSSRPELHIEDTPLAISPSHGVHKAPPDRMRYSRVSPFRKATAMSRRFSSVRDSISARKSSFLVSKLE